MKRGSMKTKYLSTHLFLTTFLLLAPSYGADNILTNPGFETGDTSGWSAFGCNMSAVGVSHSGSYGCLANNRSGTWSGPSQSLLGLISDEQTCSISGWVRLQNSSSDSIGLTIQQIDDSGTHYHPIQWSTGRDDIWTELSGFFTLDVNGTLTQLRMYFEGPDPNVNFYLDDASVVVTSSGNWEAEANERIEQIRKGDFRITVVSGEDPDIAVPDVNVQVIQTRHQFAFGSEMSWQQMDNTRYLNFFKDHFEWAVMGNASKWYTNEPTEDYVTYQKADKIYNWCNANNITMRGHCIFWAAESVVQDWIKDLSYAPLPAASELRSAVEDRLDSAVNHFKGKFLHWDVNNEMCNNSFFADRLGYDIRTWMFQAAAAIDPDCTLFLNDYNVINGGYNLSAYKQMAYDLAAQGAPVGGLGVQCHMTTGFSPATVKARFDSVSEVNLPVWVTEFDVSEPNENVRADELEDFYRVAFSEPSVEGILMWGFWQDNHWRENCYIVNSDWSLNAAGERYEALMNEWTTNDSNFTDENGNADFRGFYGTYAVVLTPADGNSEVHTIEMTDSSGTNEFTLQLGTGTPADYNAPSAEPFTWLSPPQAVAADTIKMTAPEANDISGVEYYFNNVIDPNHNSGWQDSTTYVDAGLKPNTPYSYRFKIRDKSIFKNETSYSPAAAALTPGNGGNILTNPGFESASIAGWTTWGCDLTAVTDQVHTGSYSGLVKARSQTWQGFVQVITDKVRDGETYQCSAWVRLDNSTSENASIMLSQTDDSGTHYPYVTSATAYNDQWVKLQGSFTLDVNGVLEQLSIYISGPAPDVNFYMDDAVVVAEPVNCSEVQQAGFNLDGDITGDCQVNLTDVEMLSRNWMNTDCTISGDCLDADIEFDGWIDLFDFAFLASDWLNCNNPQDSNCIQNW
jgi:endo-1,4-beta-xylanase